jgi:hypothetical protein
MRGPTIAKPKPAKPSRLRIRLSTTRERKPPTFPSPPIASVPTCEPVTFEQLNDKHCRYIAGDGPPFMFCGADKTEGSSYCVFHRQQCHIGYVAVGPAEAEIRRRLMARERRAA